jgi:hypothetical protein
MSVVGVHHIAKQCAPECSLRVSSVMKESFLCIVVLTKCFALQPEQLLPNQQTDWPDSIRDRFDDETKFVVSIIAWRWCVFLVKRCSSSVFRALFCV